MAIEMCLECMLIITKLIIHLELLVMQEAINYLALQYNDTVLHTVRIIIILYNHIIMKVTHKTFVNYNCC